MMKRLGEILLDHGAIAIAELHTGLEACHHSGGRLGTQLLKFGFVDEHALLEALEEQLEVPSVSAAILRRAPEELQRMVPLHVARRLQAMVFERKNGHLGVAMTTPRSPATLEEIVSYVGMDIKPHVSTEVGILAALADGSVLILRAGETDRRAGWRAIQQLKRVDARVVGAVLNVVKPETSVDKYYLDYYYERSS